MLVLLVIMMVAVWYCDAASVNKGEEIIQRRLGESIIEQERERYESLLATSASLRKDIAVLSRLLPDDMASNQIKELNVQLQQTIRDTLEISQQSGTSGSRRSAADRAVERARRRQSIRQLEETKKRREVEDFNYIQNMRKMQLVDKTVRELQSRAIFHGLDEYGMK